MIAVLRYYGYCNYNSFEKSGELYEKNQAKTDSGDRTRLCGDNFDRHSFADAADKPKAECRRRFS